MLDLTPITVICFPCLPIYTIVIGLNKTRYIRIDRRLDRKAFPSQNRAPFHNYNLETTIRFLRMHLVALNATKRRLKSTQIRQLATLGLTFIRLLPRTSSSEQAVAGKIPLYIPSYATYIYILLANTHYVDPPVSKLANCPSIFLQFCEQQVPMMVNFHKESSPKTSFP